MKKLFLVQLNTWKSYYVMASDFNEASVKVLSHVEKNTPVLSEDGSLQSTEPLVVKKIELMSENIIR